MILRPGSPRLTVSSLTAGLLASTVTFLHALLIGGFPEFFMLAEGIPTQQTRRTANGRTQSSIAGDGANERPAGSPSCPASDCPLLRLGHPSAATDGNDAHRH